MLRLALHDWVIAWDRRDGRAWLGGRAVDERIDRLDDRLAEVRERALGLGGRREADAVDGGETAARLELRSGLDRTAYEAGVERIRGWIADGQIYQANLTRRLATPFRGDPWPLYRRLRTGDPALFAAFLDLGASPLTGAPRAIASASPEPFIAVSSRRPGRDEPDQGHPAPWPRSRGRSPARLRAPRLREGPRRERDDRGRPPQRPRARLHAGDRPRPAPVPPRADGRGAAPRQHGVGRPRPGSRRVRRPRGLVPRRLDHRRTQDPGDGAAGTAGARSARAVHRASPAGSGRTGRWPRAS